jgi:DNA-binding NtrC family response regulator
LSGFAIHLPRLRDRLEDLGILISQIWASAGESKSSRLTLEAARALFTYDWPRNVRELEHRARLAAVLAKDGPIEREHLFGDDSHRAPSEGVRSTDNAASSVLDPEDVARRDELKALLREHKGNVTAVARAMGKARVQVQRWIRRYELKRRDPG